jgi:hypothetical protein
MQVIVLWCEHSRITVRRRVGGQKGAFQAQRLETDGVMAILSQVAGSVLAVVAVAAGVPLLVMLFLGVLGYCCLEWLHDTLVLRQSIPTRPMRTVGVKP